jgi:AraC-like DNA-binding protein
VVIVADMAGRVDIPVVYREDAPPPSLASPVACLWVGETEPGPQGPVLPDGCVDITWIAGRELVVAGPDTGPVDTPLAVGDVVVGLRFRPGMAATGLGVPADLLRDSRTALGDVWGERPAAELAERLALAPTPAAAEQVLAETVQARRPEPTERDRSIAAAADWLRSDAAPVADLADQFNLSERQLLRRFQTAVGYGPKTLARVFRFQRFRRLAATSPDAGLADLAAMSGYSDQAHLTRECQRLGGATPVRIVQDVRGGRPVPSSA